MADIFTSVVLKGSRKGALTYRRPWHSTIIECMACQGVPQYSVASEQADEGDLLCVRRSVNEPMGDLQHTAAQHRGAQNSHTGGVKEGGEKAEQDPSACPGGDREPLLPSTPPPDKLGSRLTIPSCSKGITSCFCPLFSQD